MKKLSAFVAPLLVALVAVPVVGLFVIGWFAPGKAANSGPNPAKALHLVSMADGIRLRPCSGNSTIAMTLDMRQMCAGELRAPE